MEALLLHNLEGFGSQSAGSSAGSARSSRRNLLSLSPSSTLTGLGYTIEDLFYGCASLSDCMRACVCIFICVCVVRVVCVGVFFFLHRSQSLVLPLPPLLFPSRKVSAIHFASNRPHSLLVAYTPVPPPNLDESVEVNNMCVCVRVTLRESARASERDRQKKTHAQRERRGERRDSRIEWWSCHSTRVPV